MPASSAANLTSIPAANLTGTIAAISGVNLTSLDAANLGSNTVPTARLGSGTASSTTVLYGDQTYKTEPSGKVKQIIYNSSIPTSAKNTTSTSFVDTGLECTITPTSSDSKILLIAAFGYRNQTGSGREGSLTFYVDDTTNLGGANYGWSFWQGVGASYGESTCMVQVHAPASTSSIDYSVYFKSNNTDATCSAWAAYTGATMLAIEIDGTAE
jgi:hypothetical protein